MNLWLTGGRVGAVQELDKPTVKRGREGKGYKFESFLGSESSFVTLPISPELESGEKG